MRFLLDTCVVSALAGNRGEEAVRVAQWMRSHDERDMHLSVLTVGELHKGIEKLEDRARRNALLAWVETDLRYRFRGRVLAVDEDVARTWGQIQARAESCGRRMPVMDSLIAATAVRHGLAVVTRNGADMAESGVEVVDPWRG